MYDGFLAHAHPTSVEYEDVGGANVAWVFADYQEEYQAIRQSAALFDHSAVGLTRISGDASPLLSQVLARDTEFLEPERCIMTLMLDDDGAPIDLMTVYSFDDYVLLESSLGRAEAARSHLRSHATGDIEVTALDGDWGMIGIEGPYAWGVVGQVLDPAITALPYESTLEIEWESANVVFARSGFTGEYGYKLIGDLDTVSALWQALSKGATPAGQKALETAMLEVRQPILHRQVNHGNNVVTCGIQWLIDPGKKDFIGRLRVLEMLEDLGGRKTLGLAWDEAGGQESGSAAPPHASTEVLAGGVTIGSVDFSVFSPGLGRHLGLATVDREFAAAGLELSIQRAGRANSAVSLSSPYVVPTSWTTPIL